MTACPVGSAAYRERQKVTAVEILRRKDVYNHEAGEHLQIAQENRAPARWYGSGCAQAGFTPGSEVYPYYLVPLAGHFGCQDITCPGGGGAVADIASALEAHEVAPAPDMDDAWVIAAVPHDAYQCPRWPFPHVHCLVVMGTPAEVRRAMRDHEDAMMG